MQDTLLIVNPHAGGGRTARVFGEVRPRIEAALGPHDVGETKGPADAIRIAHEAAMQGRKLVVAVGGDGTVHEVVNGLVMARGGSSPLPVLGIIGMGTGGDFTKTLGIEHKLDHYLEVLKNGRDHPLDVGRLDYLDHQGRPSSRHFVNILSMGISGLADQIVAQASRALGSNFAYFQASVRSLLRSRVGDCVLRVTDAAGEVSEHRWQTRLIAVCNGRYFGSGMMIGPMAEPDDGLFDVVGILLTNRFRLALRLQSVYSGAHAKTKEFVHLRARKVEIHLENEAEAGERFILDVDGEPLGRLPITIEALPRVLTVRRPA